jgi:protein ImuB
LARGAAADVTTFDDLPGRLGALPLSVTYCPESIQTLLHDLGLRSVGDCLRLPRDGFARRVGEPYLAELDRALGRRFDLRPEFTAPQRWKLALDLHEESSDCAVFMEAIELLVDRLVAALRRGQSQIRSLRVTFEHLRRPPTLESFTLLTPTHERERLLNVVRDRVERLVLPAPVVALGMSTGPFLVGAASALGLFEKTPVETAACTLFERLRGRFGFAAVYGMGLIAEHRPERAWTKIDCAVDACRRDQSAVSRDRPLWLLLEPLPLESTAAHRYYDGSIRCHSGPERIESGWWDGQDVGRDYYVAQSSRGQRLWIYRDRESRVWHLHGLFG